MLSRLAVAARIALILALAVLTGPTPALSGDRVVFCGADGVKRVVVFDFETGEPAAPAPTLHECEECVGAPKFILAGATALPHTHGRGAASAAGGV
ncbi:MAG: hypothetical protein AAGF90_02610, partial [Pseudomonadota bacterium]